MELRNARYTLAVSAFLVPLTYLFHEEKKKERKSK